MGFILNTPTDYRLGFVKLPIHRKHWIAIRWLQGQYMNLDSKLNAPVAIGDQASLYRYLRSELSDGEKELLLVVEKSVYDASSWRRDSDCSMRDESNTCEASENSDKEQEDSKTACSRNGAEIGTAVDNDSRSQEVKGDDCGIK